MAADEDVQRFVWERVLLELFSRSSWTYTRLQARFCLIVIVCVGYIKYLSSLLSH